MYFHLLLFNVTANGVLPSGTGSGSGNLMRVIQE
jgi:hypothetical protein